MRQTNQAIAAKFAPGTQITVAQLHKIKRTVVFRSEASFFASRLLPFVDLYQRPGAKQRIHGVVAQTDKPPSALADVRRLQQAGGYRPPCLNEARDQFRFVRIEPRIEADWEADFFFSRRRFEIDQVRSFVLHAEVLATGCGRIDEEVHQGGDGAAIDGAERVQLEKAWGGFAVFNLHQACMRNGVIVVIFAGRNHPAKFVDLTRSQSASGAQSLQHFSRIFQSERLLDKYWISNNSAAKPIVKIVERKIFAVLPPSFGRHRQKGATEEVAGRIRAGNPIKGGRMHFGGITIDSGLILGILWCFGWPIYESFQERRADKERQKRF